MATYRSRLISTNGANQQYSDLLRDRRDAERALAFMRMAYERDFDRLSDLVGMTNH